MNHIGKRNRLGFTLAEILIVVAIIAVLVGISIPLFTSQLAKSKVATNQANIRAAKASANANYLTYEQGKCVTYVYDIKTGKLVKMANSDLGTSFAGRQDSVNNNTEAVISSDITAAKSVGNYLSSKFIKDTGNGIYSAISVIVNKDGTMQTSPYYDASQKKIIYTRGTYN